LTRAAAAGTLSAEGAAMSSTAAQRPLIGLALGGGAARGAAHIGVLKVLAEEGIPIDRVAGTSVGSVVGAAFCAGLSWKDILSRARRIDWPDVASLTLPRMGFLRMERFEGLIRDTIGVEDFRDLSIPFSTIAVDLATGREVIFASGPIARAVRASCSVPGVFEPVLEGEGVLVDGGLLNEVPADVVRRMGADVVLAVSLTADRRHDAPPRNVLDIIYYSFDILLAARTQESLKAADLVVAPQLAGFAYRDLKRIDELVDRGERAMRGALGKLKQIIAATTPRSP
jgi:NTE family protein